MIGPIATWIGNILGAAVLSIYQFSPIVAGIAVGAIWQVLVMFGLTGDYPDCYQQYWCIRIRSLWMVLGQATPFANCWSSISGYH